MLPGIYSGVSSLRLDALPVHGMLIDGLAHGKGLGYSQGT